MTANPAQPSGPQLPATPRIRLEGTVTAVHADGRFTLGLPTGKELTGTAGVDHLRQLGKFIGRRVVLLGTETADGKVRADDVLPADRSTGPEIAGRRLTASEIAEFEARIRAVADPRAEATEAEMDAMMKDDR